MNQEKQKVWWDENCRKHTVNTGSTKSEIDSLKERLLTVSSMAFTRIPRLLSKDTPDSMLILMRKEQLEMISRRPPRALLTGKTGKKLCVELGAHTIGSKDDKNVLISFASFEDDGFAKKFASLSRNGGAQPLVLPEDRQQ